MVLQDILKSVDNALTERIGDDEELETLEVQSLAEGRYNHLWTVTYAAKHQVGTLGISFFNIFVRAFVHFTEVMTCCTSRVGYVSVSVNNQRLIFPGP